MSCCHTNCSTLVNKMSLISAVVVVLMASLHVEAANTKFGGKCSESQNPNLSLRRRIKTQLMCRQVKNKIIGGLLQRAVGAPRAEVSPEVPEVPPEPVQTSAPISSGQLGVPRALPLNRNNMVFAEPVDLDTPNVMLFRLQSWHNISHLSQVNLNVNLKPQRRRRDRRDRRDRKPSRHIRNLSSSDPQSNPSRETSAPEVLCTGDKRLCRDKQTSNRKATDSVLQKKRIKKLKGKKSLKKKKRRKKKKKGHTVRLVIFALGVEGMKKKVKLGTLRTTVKKLKTESVGLPLELVQNAAKSESRQITLQIRCKRCKGRVRIENVYKKRKSSRKSRSSKRNRRLLNPNRPYLVLEYNMPTVEET